MCPAFSAHILLYGFAYEQRYVFCLQIQILQDVVINSLYSVRPVGIAVVGFALMQEDALDNTLLLGYFCQFYQSGVWISVVLGCKVLHPVGLFLEISLIGTLIEEVDAGSAHGHGDGSHLDAVWQVIHHLSSEIVNRSQSCRGSCLWRHGGVPLSLLPSRLFIIHGIHSLESRVHARSVDVFDSRISFHVRLSEAEINLKIRIRLFLNLTARFLCHHR